MQRRTAAPTNRCGNPRKLSSKPRFTGAPRSRPKTSQPVVCKMVTMSQAALLFKVSLMVVRRMIAQKILPARQVVKCAPWMIERVHLELPAVQKEIRRVHEGRRSPLIVLDKSQTRLFTDSNEV